jgi:hypothetical protein
MRLLATLLTAFVLATAFVSTAPAAFAQAKDGLVGNWTLERGKSTFEPDNDLQNRSLEITAKDGGMGFLQRTVTGRGNTVQIEFDAKYDSKDVPISGSQLDTVALKRVDANTVERAGKIKGKVVETVSFKLSNGGKTLTMTTKGSIDGDDYSSTQVFEKQ